jgi:hypothetical protein
MKKVFVYISLALLLISLIGCSTGPQSCVEPAIPMTDINGNTVCVYPVGHELSVDKDIEETEESIDENVEEEKPLLGGDRDEHGCIGSAGYVWCESLEECIRPWETECPEETIVGGDKDEHGCIGSAGYVWCESLEECIKPWETECPEETIVENEEKMLDISSLTEQEKASLPKKIVKEGELVNFPNLKAVDPDGRDVTYSFTYPLDNKGEWQTKIGDYGEYLVMISASDGIDITNQKVLIIIQRTNTAPIIQDMDDIVVFEGQRVTVVPIVTDNEGDKITLTFKEPLDNRGIWDTEPGDAGIYSIEVTASDGMLSSSKNVFIEVLEKNLVPIIDIEDTIIVDEGETIILNPNVTDPDGDDITVTYSGWMTSNTYTTKYDDSGEYIVTITASDGVNTVSKDVKIIVNDVNRPPQFVEGAFD